jgi:hypothetical protein
MGCLKKLIKNILIFIAVICFFALGGFVFLRDKIEAFNNPPREKAIEMAHDFGDFSGISSDYKIGRTYGLFGYKKLTITFKPSNDKITFVRLPNQKKVKISDFVDKNVDKTLQNFTENFDRQLIKLQNVKAGSKGVVMGKNKIIYYSEVDAEVKNLPFKKLKGITGVYELRGKDGKKEENPEKRPCAIVLYLTDAEKYSLNVPLNILKKLKL